VEAIVSSSVQTGPGAHPASYTMGTIYFPGVKWPGRGNDHLPQSSAEVKGVPLYLYSPSGPSCPVLGQSLPSICADDIHLTPARSPFVGETFLFYLRTQCVPRSKHCPPLLHKTNLLMLHKAKVAVCFEIHTTRQCERHVEFLKF
jgi:hypothetical protein